MADRDKDSTVNGYFPSRLPGEKYPQRFGLDSTIDGEFPQDLEAGGVPGPSGPVVSFSSTADWQSARTSSNVAAESIANTPRDNASEAQRGYSYTPPDYKDDMVAWWLLANDQFTEPIGPVGGYDAIQTGRPGAMNMPSMGFNRGDESDVSINNIPQTGSTFSIGFWSKPGFTLGADNNTYYMFSHAATSQGDRIYISYDNSAEALSFTVGETGQNFPDADFQQDKFNHVAIAYDSVDGTVYPYCNGEQLDTFVDGNFSGMANISVYIGAQNFDFGNYTGDIMSVMLWSDLKSRELLEDMGNWVDWGYDLRKDVARL